MRVLLFYCLRKVWPSGMTAFTAHLAEGLRRAGHEPIIVRPSTKRGTSEATFGEYGIRCLTMGVMECVLEASMAPSIVTATNVPERLPHPRLLSDLQEVGARVVMHDPTQFVHLNPESTNKTPLAPKLLKPPIMIRRQMQKFYPDGIYIPHPYVQQFATSSVPRNRVAVCTARIASSKRPRLILQANRLLPKSRRIVLAGAGNLLVEFGLSRSYPDVYVPRKKSVSYPQTLFAPVDLCRRFYYHVDMSKFPQDGGGTQYAQLEAIDAGCVPIMHSDWFENASKEDTFVAGEHVLAVDGPEHLAAIVRSTSFDRDARIFYAGQRMLDEHHDAVRVARKYLKELRR